MFEYIKLVDRKTKILILASATLIVIFIGLLLYRPFSPAPETDDSNRVSTLQKTTIGQTTKEGASQNRKVIKQEALGGNRTRLVFESTNPIKPDEVIIENGVVVFERINTPEKITDSGYSLITDFTAKYGEAEKVYKGHRLYGEFEYTYAFPSKGFSIVANPFTKEVFEIQVYAPTTVEGYFSKYGSDIEEKPTKEAVPE